jgi:hypothetical protein
MYFVSHFPTNLLDTCVCVWVRRRETRSKQHELIETVTNNDTSYNSRFYLPYSLLWEICRFAKTLDQLRFDSRQEKEIFILLSSTPVLALGSIQTATKLVPGFSQGISGLKLDLTSYRLLVPRLRKNWEKLSSFFKLSWLRHETL